MSIHHIVTRYGHKIDFLDPDPAEIDIRDICVALSRLARYNGHTVKPYYVAQHVCFAADLAGRHEREAFAHDWSEAYASDVNSPLKSLLPDYRRIEFQLEFIIAYKFGLNYPWPTAVKEVDARLFVTEVRDLTGHDYWKDYNIEPFDFKIKPWSSARCEREFMARFERLLLFPLLPAAKRV